MVACAMAVLPATAASETEPKAESSTAALLIAGADSDRPQGSREGPRMQRRLRLAGESPGPESKPKSTREPAGAPARKRTPGARPSSGSRLSSSAVLLILVGIAMLTGLVALVAAYRPTRRRPTDPASRSRRAEPSPFGVRAPSTEGASADGSPVLGYATVATSAHLGHGPDLHDQAEAVADECRRRGLVLLAIVHEREPPNRKSLERPGLGYALDRISAGEATGLVVADVCRLSRSLSEFGPVLDWFSRSDARLVAVAQGLDTAETDGQRAAQTLIQVSRLPAQADG
jgi:Resolvase, N terminal domain